MPCPDVSSLMHSVTTIVGMASPVLGVLRSVQEQIEETCPMASLIVDLKVRAISLIATMMVRVIFSSER